MNMFTKHIGRFPLEMWIALVALSLLHFKEWTGQAYSPFNKEKYV